MQTGQPQVEAESVLSLQQMHMFAPRQIDMYSLVPRYIEVIEYIEYKCTVRLSHIYKVTS